MAGKPRLPLVLTDAERRTLEGWASRRRTAQGLAQRARIVLLCAEGKSNIAVAAELGITRETVGRWRNRFVTARFAGLREEPRARGAGRAGACAGCPPSWEPPGSRSGVGLPVWSPRGSRGSVTSPGPGCRARS